MMETNCSQMPLSVHKCFVVQVNHYHDLTLYVFEPLLAEEWVTPVWGKLYSSHCMGLKWGFRVLLLSLACGPGPCLPAGLVRYLVFVKHIEILKLEGKV